MEDHQQIESLLQGFDSVGLTELSDQLLFKRKEKKFYFSIEYLNQVLTVLHEGFNVLEIEQNRVQSYYSSYLDTKNYRTYIEHHNGRKNRFKLRFRDYMNSGISFFEIKQKTNKEVTLKQRIPVPFKSRKLSQEIQKFIKEVIDVDGSRFIPSIDTSYQRISLVSPSQNARISIDYGLSYFRDKSKVEHPRLVILELKYDPSFPYIQYLRRFKDLGILPRRISKYTIGISTLIRNLKNNNFKMKLLKIEQIHQTQTI